MSGKLSGEGRYDPVFFTTRFHRGHFVWDIDYLSNVKQAFEIKYFFNRMIPVREQRSKNPI